MNNNKVRFTIVKKTTEPRNRVVVKRTNRILRVNTDSVNLTNLIDYLKKDSSVATLKIDHHHKEVSVTHTKHLHELFSCGSMKSIYLFNLEINHSTSYVIFQSISMIKNINLSKLVFNDCSLGYDHVYLIIRGIKTNSQIKELAIVNNYLPINIIKMMSDHLSENATLLRLSLCNNMIDNKGAEYIGKLLETNDTITNLSLCSNVISDMGMSDLFDSLKLNKSVTCLEFSLNPFTQESILKVVDSIYFNNCIKHINMYGVIMSPNNYRALVEKLEQNYSLESFGINPIDNLPVSMGNKEITKILDRNKENKVTILNNMRFRKTKNARQSFY